MPVQRVASLVVVGSAAALSGGCGADGASAASPVVRVWPAVRSRSACPPAGALQARALNRGNLCAAQASVDRFRATAKAAVDETWRKKLGLADTDGRRAFLLHQERYWNHVLAEFGECYTTKEHPLKGISTPMIAFPGSLRELRAFLRRLGRSNFAKAFLIYIYIYIYIYI